MSDNLKSCVVESPDKNLEQDIAILMVFEKILNCGRRNYNRANVISFVEQKWTRRLRSSEQTSSTPLRIQKAELKPIALPPSCSLKAQKPIYRLLLDRCLSLANCAYICSLVPSPNCKYQRAKESFRHFLFECERHRAHGSDKYFYPDINDEDWITELIKIIEDTKLDQAGRS